MTQQLNAMQESIKIALDAADAATDVTSEYKRIKNEYLKTEQKMKEIHKYTTIIFSSSIATAVIAIILTGLLYFKSLSELEDMTSTSREALVVFAENVENVNKAVDNMNSSLARHTDLLNASEEMKFKIEELSNLSSGLSKSIKSETDKLGKSIQESGVMTSASVNKELSKLMQDNKKNQSMKLLKELSNSTSSLNAALEAISSQNKLLVKEIKDQKENITFP